MILVTDMKEQFKRHLEYLGSVKKRLVDEHSHLIERLILLPFNHLYLLLLFSLSPNPLAIKFRLFVLVNLCVYIYKRKSLSCIIISVFVGRTVIALLAPLLMVHATYTTIKRALSSVFTMLNFVDLASTISSSRIGENVITGVILAPVAAALFTIFLVYAVIDSFCRAAFSELTKLPRLTTPPSFAPAAGLRALSGCVSRGVESLAAKLPARPHFSMWASYS